MSQKTEKMLLNKISPDKKITVEEIGSSRKIDSELEKLCQDEWTRLKVEADKQNKLLWNSEVYRLELVEENKKTITIKVSTIPFSIRLAMNSFSAEIKKLGPDYASLGMFTSCFIQTSDNKYIFIEKSNKFYTKKKIAFIGGILNKDISVPAKPLNLKTEVLKEIKEEIGVEKKCVNKIDLLTIYTTENLNVCLLFNVSLDLKFNEVKEVFQKNNDGEAKGLLEINQKDLKAFCLTLEAKDQVKFKYMNVL